MVGIKRLLRLKVIPTRAPATSSGLLGAENRATTPGPYFRVKCSIISSPSSGVLSFNKKGSHFTLHSTLDVFAALARFRASTTHHGHTMSLTTLTTTLPADIGGGGGMGTVHKAQERSYSILTSKWVPTGLDRRKVRE